MCFHSSNQSGGLGHRIYLFIICNKSICVQAVCAVDLDHKKAVCQTWEAKSGVQGAEAAVQGAGGAGVSWWQGWRKAGGRRQEKQEAARAPAPVPTAGGFLQENCRPLITGFYTFYIIGKIIKTICYILFRTKANY